MREILGRKIGTIQRVAERPCVLREQSSKDVRSCDARIGRCSACLFSCRYELAWLRVRKRTVAGLKDRLRIDTSSARTNAP